MERFAPGGENGKVEVAHTPEKGVPVPHNGKNFRGESCTAKP